MATLRRFVNHREIFVVVLLFVVGFTVGQGVFGLRLAEDANVEPQCPPTVVRGDQVRIDLVLTNRRSVPVTIQKSGLIAHVGNLNVVGPLVQPLVQTLQPFEVVTVANYLNFPFPREASPGIFTTVGVTVLDARSVPLGIGGCQIEIQ